jgi:phage/plasmid-associated DNA primase
MQSTGVIKVTCPLGEYYKAIHEKRVIAETITSEEATKILDVYVRGYKDGRQDEQTRSNAHSETSSVRTESTSTAVTNTVVVTAEAAAERAPVTILGLSNGILQLDTLTTRPYTLKDGLILRAGKVKPSLDSIPYLPWEDVSREIRMELMTFFEQLFPDTQLREWIFALLSSCLLGNKRQPRILIFQGDGGNGKTALQTLLEGTFGEYYTTLTPSLLSRKTISYDKIERQVDERRIVHFAEPDGKIHGAFLKALLEDPTSSAVPFLSCNTLPHLVCSDDSVWSRIRVIPMTSVFCSSSPTPGLGESHTVFPADLELKAKLLRWRIPLLGLLVHNLTMEVREPECVLVRTAEYRSRYDPYYKFVTTQFPREGTIELKQLRGLIRVWKTRTNEDVKEHEILDQVRINFGNRIN